MYEKMSRQLSFWRRRAPTFSMNISFLGSGPHPHGHAGNRNNDETCNHTSRRKEDKTPQGQPVEDPEGLRDEAGSLIIQASLMTRHRYSLGCRKLHMSRSQRTNVVQLRCLAREASQDGFSFCCAALGHIVPDIILDRTNVQPSLSHAGPENGPALLVGLHLICTTLLEQMSLELSSTESRAISMGWNHLAESNMDNRHVTWQCARDGQGSDRTQIFHGVGSLLSLRSRLRRMILPAVAPFALSCSHLRHASKHISLSDGQSQSDKSQHCLALGQLFF